MSYNELNNVIERMLTIQENAIEYNKTKKISHYSKEIYALSAIAAITLLINIGNITNIVLIKSLQIMTILTVGITVKKYAKLKAIRRRIKNEFPKTNFKKYDIKENQKTIMRLLKQKTQYARAEQEKARRQKFEEQLNQMQNTKPIELACQAPPVHKQEPDTRGYKKTIPQRRG